MNKAWDLAGLTIVCKTVRKGFDSLPRLHFLVETFPRDLGPVPCPRLYITLEIGRRFGLFERRYTRRELEDLVIFHHGEHVKAATERSNLRDRLIEVQRELSALKRTQ
jgi:hypothetical protein